MAAEEKEQTLRLQRFSGKSDEDFSLWMIRVEALLEALNLWEVANPETTEGDKGNVSEEGNAGGTGREEGGEHSPSSAQHAEKGLECCRKRKKAAAMLVNALGDLPLRVIQGSERDPRAMLRKLTERYASSKPTTRVAVMTEMVTKRYSTLEEDMGSYVDAFSALVNRLKSMKVDVSEMLQVTILLASIEVQQLVPVITSIRTLTNEADLTWDNVTSRLIEEHRALKGIKHKQYPKALMGGARRKKKLKKKNKCTRCSKEGHEWKYCWYNPDNSKNKLHQNISADLPAKARVACANAASATGEGGLIIDSGCTDHMVNRAALLKDLVAIKHKSVALGNNQSIKATHQGKLTVITTDNKGRSCRDDVHGVDIDPSFTGPYRYR